MDLSNKDKWHLFGLFGDMNKTRNFLMSLRRLNLFDCRWHASPLPTDMVVKNILLIEDTMLLIPRAELKNAVRERLVIWCMYER